MCNKITHNWTQHTFCCFFFCQFLVSVILLFCFAFAFRTFHNFCFCCLFFSYFLVSLFSPLFFYFILFLLNFRSFARRSLVPSQVLVAFRSLILSLSHWIRYGQLSILWAQEWTDIFVLCRIIFNKIFCLSHSIFVLTQHLRHSNGEWRVCVTVFKPNVWIEKRKKSVCEIDLTTTPAVIMDKKKTTCEIKLHPSGSVSGVYYSGQELTGIIVLTLYKQKTVKGSIDRFQRLCFVRFVVWRFENSHNRFLVVLNSCLFEYSWRWQVWMDRPTGKFTTDLLWQRTVFHSQDRFLRAGTHW